MTEPHTWTDRYPQEDAPIDFHDDKPEERPDRFVTTQPGDLDIFSRPLRQGS